MSSALASPSPLSRTAPAAVPVPSPWSAFHWALAGMVLSYVWRIQDLVAPLGQLRFATLVSAAGLGLFLLGPAASRTERLGHPVLKWVWVVAALGVLSVPGSVWPGFSARFLYEDHFKTLLFTAVLAMGVASVRDADRFVAVHVGGAVLYCVMILARFEVQADGRLGGLIYYDANDLAMLVVCTFPLVVYLARPGERGWLRVVALAALPLLVVTVMKTGSRGGFLGLVTVFALMVTTFRAVPVRQRVGAVAAALVLLAGVAGDQYWQTMGTMLRPQEDYNWSGNAQSGRMEVWKRGVGYMIQRPVLGVGVAGFGVAEGTISPLAAQQELGRGLKWSAAHNSFVQIGAELGFPGLFAFLLMLGAALRATRTLGRAVRRDGSPAPGAALAQALRASLAGYLVSGFFLSQAYSAFLYSLLALVVGLEFAARRETAEAAPGGSGAPVPPARLPLGRGGLVLAEREAAR